MYSSAPESLSESSAISRRRSLPVADVDGVLLDRERGFLDRFAQGRMGVDGAAEIFAAPAKFHHRDDFGDQFGGGMGENRGPEDTIGLSVGDEFNHAFDVLVCQRAGIGAEWEFADTHLEAFVFREVFRDTDA